MYNFRMHRVCDTYKITVRISYFISKLRQHHHATKLVFSFSSPLPFRLPLTPCSIWPIVHLFDRICSLLRRLSQRY